jgi:hypothetical protein
MISYADFFPTRSAQVQVNVSFGHGLDSEAELYTTSSRPFFQYVVRLSESNLPIDEVERAALELLGAIPHAFFDDQSCEGPGWRVVPPFFSADWPVLETEPQRLRLALEIALDVIWRHAAAIGITHKDIESVDEEVARLLAVVDQAERAGFKINMTYVS